MSVRAARRVGHHELHRPRRIGLGVGGPRRHHACRQQRRQSRRKPRSRGSHRFLPWGSDACSAAPAELARPYGPLMHDITAIPARQAAGVGPLHAIEDRYCDRSGPLAPFTLQHGQIPGAGERAHHEPLDPAADLDLVPRRSGRARCRRAARPPRTPRAARRRSWSGPRGGSRC